MEENVHARPQEGGGGRESARAHICMIAESPSGTERFAAPAMVAEEGGVPAAVESAITFGFVGLETITGVILAILLIFLNVEKTIGKKQAEIRARHEEQA